MPQRGSGPNDCLRSHPGARAGGLPRGSFGDRGGKVRAWSHPLPDGGHVPSPAPAWLQLPPPARRRTAALCLGPWWASPGASQLPSRLVPGGRRGRGGAHAGGFADHRPKPDAAQSTRENPTFGPATERRMPLGAVGAGPRYSLLERRSGRAGHRMQLGSTWRNDRKSAIIRSAGKPLRCPVRATAHPAASVSLATALLRPRCFAAPACPRPQPAFP